MKSDSFEIDIQNSDMQIQIHGIQNTCKSYKEFEIKPLASLI